MKQYLRNIARAAFFLVLITTISTYNASDVAAQAITTNDPALRNIDIVEHSGDKLPLDVVLTDDAGRTTTLGAYFDGKKPVIVVMAYYTCPMLCSMVLNGVAQTASQLDWVPGKDYTIVTVSIDPTETASLAAAKKVNYIKSMNMPEAANGWTFCVAEESQSKKLADALGFKYYYDEDLKQYAHAAAIYIITPEGEISRYLYGIEFKKQDFRLALLEASEGKIGTTIDRILLYCYHYDPAAGGYVMMATNVMKLGGAVTLAVLVVFLGIFWLREWRRRHLRPQDHKA